MAPTTVCLGGYDLEMVEIRRLLEGIDCVEVQDRRLSWGAKASAYSSEVRAALKSSNRVILIELTDDLPADIARENIIFIDHHGDAAGRDRPTSIEQMLRLLEVPRSKWTRDLELVAANDRGHIAAMVDMGASREEIEAIRRRDRQAQGITAEEENQGREAIRTATTYLSGRLTVVELPHGRTATVTDAMDARLGGPGYENLLILSQGETCFFGDGRAIAKLREWYPESWCGGELPVRGFWGHGKRLQLAATLQLIDESQHA